MVCGAWACGACPAVLCALCQLKAGQSITAEGLELTSRTLGPDA